MQLADWEHTHTHSLYCAHDLITSEAVDPIPYFVTSSAVAGQHLLTVKCPRILNHLYSELTDSTDFSEWLRATAHRGYEKWIAGRC